MRTVWIDVDLPLIHFDDVSGTTVEEIVGSSNPCLAPFTHPKMKALPTIHTNSENNHISPTNQ